MEIVKQFYLNDKEIEKYRHTPCVIAMGTFDGLHKGHRDVIDTAASYAASHQLRLAVFTFSNHPYATIRPSAIPQSLLSPEEKIRLLKRWGVHLLIDVPFNKQLSILSPETFLQKLKQFNYSCLVCGANFSYGFKGTGNIDSLKKAGEEQGFDPLRREISVMRNICWDVSAVWKELFTKAFNEAGRLVSPQRTCMWIAAELLCHRRVFMRFKYVTVINCTME